MDPLPFRNPHDSGSDRMVVDHFHSSFPTIQDEPDFLPISYHQPPVILSSSNGSFGNLSQSPSPFELGSHSIPRYTFTSSHRTQQEVIDESLLLPVGFPLSTATPRPLRVQDTIGDDVVSLSTAFNPNHEPLPDTCVVSSDGVLFYINSNTIIDRCPAAFQSVISASLSEYKFRTTNVHLDAPSEVLSVILHALYITSPAVHSPDFDTLVRAIDRMPYYSIPPNIVIYPSTPLYGLVLSYAPLHPLETYALASHHRLHAMAVCASSHLLSFDLSSISDEMAERMGSIYLKRLLQLHIGRSASLRTILLHPPLPHPPTKQCGFENQKKMTRAWSLVSAYLAWDGRPDLSTYSIHAALDPLTQHVQCSVCHEALDNRIRDVVVQWASVQVSLEALI